MINKSKFGMGKSDKSYKLLLRMRVESESRADTNDCIISWRAESQDNFRSTSALF